jgi:ubiquitin-protein ligase
MLRRLNNELLKVPRTGAIRFVESVATDHQHWQVTPETGAFSGLTLDIDVHIPDSYPFKMPTIKVRQHIYHPNFMAGQICMEGIWSPPATIHCMVEQIYNCLMYPVDDNILCHDAYTLYKNNPAGYMAKAKLALADTHT